MAGYADQLFASLDRDLELERIAGGNETEVYRTDDFRFVVKLKNDLGGTRAAAVEQAKSMRTIAEEYTNCLGPAHTIPSYYLVARDSGGRVQVLVLQPFLAGARALFDLNYAALSGDERDAIATQLREIIRRSLSFYRQTGNMPDLYGRSSGSAIERIRQKSLALLPQRLWSFLIQRNLLRSHNLMSTAEPERRVVLVDYDFVRRGQLYRALYFTVRWMLFWRDHILIMRMRRSGKAPGAWQADGVRESNRIHQPS
jgi:hypothetical protein